MDKVVDSIRELMHPYFLGGEAASDYARSDNYYEWYFTYAQGIRPRRVLEIGVRLGYSAIAMVLGYPGLGELVLFDDASYGHSVLDAAQNIRRAAGSVRIIAHHLDTQAVRSLPARGEFDLIHVDGDHTYQGTIHDLGLVLPLLSRRGVIVLDDVDHISRCRKAAREFVSLYPGLRACYIPTFRGHLLIGYDDCRLFGGSPPRAHARRVMTMAKPKNRRKTADQKTRREFFQSAGRGSVAMGGVLLFGMGGTLGTSGCGEDSDTKTGQGGIGTGGAGGARNGWAFWDERRGHGRRGRQCLWRGWRFRVTSSVT